MQYIVTWSEGDEVCYRFVDEKEVNSLIEEDKKYIVAVLPN